MGTSFKKAFPELLEGAQQLYQSMSAIAMVILFGGLLVAAGRGAFGSIQETMRGILSVGILTTVIAVFPDWVDLLQGLFHGLVEELDADPSKSHEEFAKLISGGETEKPNGFWDILFDKDRGFGKAMIFAAVLFIGKLAWLVMWLATWLQHLILIYGIALAPISLSMFMLNATRGMAVRYVMSLLGVLMVPLGWTFVHMGTRALLQLAADDKIYLIENDAVVLGAQSIFFILLLSIWILVGTVAAPKLVFQAIQTGSQIGAALAGTLGSSVARGVSYGAGAGMTMGMAGASAGAVAAGASAGAIGGLASGATGGSGIVGPTLIGAMAMTAGGSSSKNVNQEAAEIAAANQD